MTTIVDDFDRATGDIGANWTTLAWLQFELERPQLVDGKVYPAGGSIFTPGNRSGAVWNRALTYDADVSIALAEVGSQANVSGLLLRITDPTTSPNGYYVEADPGSGTVTVNELTDGMPTGIISWGMTFETGNVLGARQIGATITVYCNGEPIGSVIDTTHRKAGYAGIYANGEIGLDDFAVDPIASYRNEVMIDLPSAYFRLGEADGTRNVAVDELGGTSGAHQGGFSINASSLLATDANAAVGFNGSSGCCRVADRTALDLGDRFSLEAWVYLDAAPDDGAGCIVDKGAGAAILRTTPDNRVLLRRNDVADIVTSRVALSARTVYHVVATKDGTTSRLYLDGVDQTGTVTNSTMADNALPFCIGAADGGTVNFWPGRIDEVAVYKGTALSAARVLAHYRAGAGAGAGANAALAAYDGTSWATCPLNVYDGSAWRQAAGLVVL